jgi:hypothetical protein
VRVKLRVPSSLSKGRLPHTRFVTSMPASKFRSPY